MEECVTHLDRADSDHSGFIDFNEFKTVFSANLGPDAIPFDFDWSVSL